MYGGQAAAAIAQAIKASGAIIRVEPRGFRAIVDKMESPLIVTAEGGVLKTSYRYLASYKGLVFYTKSPEPMRFGGRAELIAARKIWIPT